MFFEKNIMSEMNFFEKLWNENKKCFNNYSFIRGCDVENSFKTFVPIISEYVYHFLMFYEQNVDYIRSASINTSDFNYHEKNEKWLKNWIKAIRFIFKKLDKKIKIAEILK